MSSSPSTPAAAAANFLPDLDWELLRYDAGVRMQRKLLKAAAMARRYY
jgi:hypothetical protein